MCGWNSAKSSTSALRAKNPRESIMKCHSQISLSFWTMKLPQKKYILRHTSIPDKSYWYIKHTVYNLRHEVLRHKIFHHLPAVKVVKVLNCDSLLSLMEHPYSWITNCWALLYCSLPIMTISMYSSTVMIAWVCFQSQVRSVTLFKEKKKGFYG